MAPVLDLILEDVQPSWMQDAFGIQGEQSDVSFDNETSWDTTAWSKQNQTLDELLCCGECTPESACELPSEDGYCKHALCLTFNPVRPATLEADGYWDRGFIAELNHVAGGTIANSVFPYFYDAGGGDWRAALSVTGITTDIDVAMSPADFFGNSHQITIQYHRDSMTGLLTIKATAYDSSSSTSPASMSSDPIIQLFIGSHFATNTEPISICGISLLANPTSDELDFNFPTDPFDSSVGSGQSISGGTVTITGNASAGQVGYLKNLDPAYGFGCCPTSVHVEACFQWYPFGLPPGHHCVVSATGSIDIPLTVYNCPIDFSTSGNKIQTFTGPLSSSAVGADCGAIDVTNADVTSHIDLFWDAVAMQWTMEARIEFPNYPASFNYGPVTVPGADLTTAGVITIVNQGCPSGGVPNPNATITFEFS